MRKSIAVFLLGLLLPSLAGAQECNTSTVVLPSGETSVCHLDCSGAVITCDFAGWSWDWASSWTPDGYPDSASVTEPSDPETERIWIRASQVAHYLYNLRAGIR